MKTRGWNSYTLGELATYLNGKAFKPSDWGKAGVPIVRIQNLTDSSKPFNHYTGVVEERYRIYTGDLLISWSATLGSFIWDRGPAVLNQHIFKVLPNAEIIDKEFLHYLILITLDEMTTHSHGIAMKHITKGKFESIKVSVPAVSEQRRIVARIKECFERVDEIEKLRAAAIEEAKATLPSMLNQTFVELGTTHEEVEIGDVTLETRYGTSRKCASNPKGIAILRIPNVAGGFVNFDELKYCPLNKKELNNIVLQKGDLLFVRTNGSRDLVGRCAIFEGDAKDQQYGFASYLIRVRLDQKKIRPHYLAFFLNSTHGRVELDSRRRTSAGQFNINSENLRTIKVPLPPLDLQERLEGALRDQQAQVIQLQRELREAQDTELHISESILRKAFAGEL